MYGIKDYLFFHVISSPAVKGRWRPPGQSSAGPRYWQALVHLPKPDYGGLDGDDDDDHDLEGGVDLGPHFTQGVMIEEKH